MAAVSVAGARAKAAVLAKLVELGVAVYAVRTLPGSLGRDVMALLPAEALCGSVS